MNDEEKEEPDLFEVLSQRISEDTLYRMDGFRTSLASVMEDTAYMVDRIVVDEHGKYSQVDFRHIDH